MGNINKKVVFAADWHFPYEDKSSSNKFLKYMDNHDVNLLILGGDMVDFYQISKFNKTPERIGNLQKDLNKYYRFMDALRSVYKGRIAYLIGNHGTRLHTYLVENPGMYGLDVLSMENILKADKYDFDLVYNYTYKDILFTHGKYANKYYAEKNLRMNMMSTVCGHVHRHMTFCKTGIDRDFYSIGSPCMCNIMKQEYTKGKPNWQNGFLVLHFNSYRLLDYEVKFTK